MIFLDSWTFIEYFSEKENNAAENLIENAKNRVISSAVLLEIKYRIAKLFGLEHANNIVYIIENLDIDIMPVTSEVASLAADLRLKYYDKKTRDLSFIDAINLATAILTGCEKFYTGDPDFKGIEEIKIENIRKA